MTDGTVTPITSAEPIVRLHQQNEIQTQQQRSISPLQPQSDTQAQPTGLHQTPSVVGLEQRTADVANPATGGQPLELQETLDLREQQQQLVVSEQLQIAGSRPLGEQAQNPLLQRSTEQDIQPQLVPEPLTTVQQEQQSTAQERSPKVDQFIHGELSQALVTHLQVLKSLKPSSIHLTWSLYKPQEKIQALECLMKDWFKIGIIMFERQLMGPQALQQFETKRQEIYNKWLTMSPLHQCGIVLHLLEHLQGMASTLLQHKNMPAPLPDIRALLKYSGVGAPAGPAAPMQLQKDMPSAITEQLQVRPSSSSILRQQPLTPTEQDVPPASKQLKEYVFSAPTQPQQLVPSKVMQKQLTPQVPALLQQRVLPETQLQQFRAPFQQQSIQSKSVWNGGHITWERGQLWMPPRTQQQQKQLVVPASQPQQSISPRSEQQQRQCVACAQERIGQKQQYKHRLPQTIIAQRPHCHAMVVPKASSSQSTRLMSYSEENTDKQSPQQSHTSARATHPSDSSNK